MNNVKWASRFKAVSSFSSHAENYIESSDALFMLLVINEDNEDNNLQESMHYNNLMKLMRRTY